MKKKLYQSTYIFFAGLAALGVLMQTSDPWFFITTAAFLGLFVTFVFQLGGIFYDDD